MRPSRFKTGASLVALALALAGCDFAPRYVPPPITPPAAYKEAGAWAPAEPGDASPRGAWWTGFQDPTLDRLEEAVPAANPTLKAALAAYDQARAFATEARAGYLPTVGGFESNTYNRQSQERLFRGGNQQNEEANNTIGAQLNYEVDLWGRVRNLVRSGEAAAQATARGPRQCGAGPAGRGGRRLRPAAGPRRPGQAAAQHRRRLHPSLRPHQRPPHRRRRLRARREPRPGAALRRQGPDQRRGRPARALRARHRQPGRPARLQLRHRPVLGGGAPDPAASPRACPPPCCSAAPTSPPPSVEPTPPTARSAWRGPPTTRP